MVEPPKSNELLEENNDNNFYPEDSNCTISDICSTAIKYFNEILKQTSNTRQQHWDRSTSKHVQSFQNVSYHERVAIYLQTVFS